MPMPKVTSKQFAEMLQECGVTHVWLVARKPTKGYRPGIDPPLKPVVKFINADENAFLPPPAFLAAFTGKGPYAEQGRHINELKKTIYDLDALQKALAVRWRDGGKD